MLDVEAESAYESIGGGCTVGGYAISIWEENLKSAAGGQTAGHHVLPNAWRPIISPEQVISRLQCLRAARIGDAGAYGGLEEFL